MPRSSGIRRLFRFSSSEARVSKDIDEEITLHLEERTLQLIAQGLEPAAARAMALAEFGDVRQARGPSSKRSDAGACATSGAPTGGAICGRT